ncbi:MAG: Metallophosphoesterase [Microgenomates bacterium 39_7]|nr:MAG: Metallophosphoesterase [Microgenomates bacterium 39_7]
MAKVLHTADIHLKEVDDERWEALKILLKVAKDKKVDVLTIAGDLFDKDVHSQQLRDKLRGLFSQLPFKIVILPGNHDAHSYDSGEFFGENVIIITDHQKPVVIDGLAIVGVPFASLTSAQLSTIIDEAGESFDPQLSSILLMHAELADLFFSSADFGDEGDKRYLPIKLSMFDQSPFDYLLAGHFHTKFQVKRLTNSRMKEGGFFLYPGSPVSITAREVGSRSAGLIEIGKPPQQITLDTAFYHPINIIFKPDDDSSKLSKIKKDLEKIPPHATGLLTVSGFFNQKVLKLNEEELHQTLKRLADQYHSQLDEQKFSVKDVSSVINSDLYQLILEKINSQNKDSAEVDKLTQFLIAALSK